MPALRGSDGAERTRRWVGGVFLRGGAGIAAAGGAAAALGVRGRAAATTNGALAPLPAEARRRRMSAPRTLVVLAVLILGGIGAWAARGSPPEGHLSAQDRALINAASMEPVQVTLASRVVGMTSIEHGGVPHLAADNRITLRVPAAFVASVTFRQEAGVNRGAPGVSSVTFWFWSRSFDPVRPDQVADAAACFPRVQRLCGDGRMAERRRNGENVITVELLSVPASEAQRRYDLLYAAGVVSGALVSPCEFHEDPVLGMLVGRVPEGQRIFRACNMGGTPALHTRTGRTFDRATFLMREADGTPRFAVRCRTFAGPDDGAGAFGCEMLGFFGVWPLTISVRSNEASEWNATFLRVHDFLASHTVARTD
jgi:hypothetical protein